jgi:hypothetical protein
MVSFPCPEWEGILVRAATGGREERLMYRTRVSMDRIGAVDDLSERGLHAFLSSSSTTGVTQEQGQARPPRRSHVEKLGS